ncbi:MAG: hypothetical protein JXX14_11060 [Deltaproteobacteria bacterium]|nr:hypothetical protein [Deltaproteobacteria bacterium]
MAEFLKTTLVTIILVLWGAGCNSSPTVPVPPPQATLIQTSVPDPDGFVTVSGAPDPRFGIDDVALVFNDNRGIGVMTDVQQNGAFETRITAQLNDLLIIQIKRDNKISEPLEKSVGE